MIDKEIQKASYKVTDAKSALIELSRGYNSWLSKQKFENGHLSKDANEQIWRFARALRCMTVWCEDLANKYEAIFKEPISEFDPDKNLTEEQLNKILFGE